MKLNVVSTSDWLFNELDKHLKHVIKSGKNKTSRISKIKNIFKNVSKKK